MVELYGLSRLNNENQGNGVMSFKEITPIHQDSSWPWLENVTMTVIRHCDYLLLLQKEI